MKPIAIKGKEHLMSLNSYKMRRLFLLILALLIAGFSTLWVNQSNAVSVLETRASASGNVNEMKRSVQETRPWWLGDLITVFGTLVGAVMIIYQLGRQHKHEMKLQKENFREKLRLDVYQEFSPVLKAANDMTQRSGMYAIFISLHMRNYHDQLKNGFNPPPISDRAIEFSKRHYEALGSATNLILLFEKYEIISPGLNIFKFALMAAHHDMEQAFAPLYELLLQILPVDMTTASGAQQVLNVIRPSEAQLQKLDKLVGAYKNAEESSGSYLYDLNVELQNIFMSKLFNNMVPKRQPLDPKAIVVSTEPELLSV